MPKKKELPDINQIAAGVVGEVARLAKESPAKNPAAVLLGRLGGLKGGKARAAKLSPGRLKAIARKASRVRWNKAQSSPTKS